MDCGYLGGLCNGLLRLGDTGASILVVVDAPPGVQESSVGRVLTTYVRGGVSTV